MLGKKNYQEKLFTSFSLSERIPENNFYKRLKKELDFSFLRKECSKYYGHCGQQSIDPEVFFKLTLVGYIEGINSDRKLVEALSLRLDVLYFLNYDIDESLPWHSTLSRTRQKLPTEVFQTLFDRVLSMCITKGMVLGHTQSIDSALIKANAALENIELKEPSMSPEQYIKEVLQQDKPSFENDENLPVKQAPRKNIKRSNLTHFSPSDPDAKISFKPGKPTNLYYQSQLVVDSKHCVITNIAAKRADYRDSIYLIDIVKQVKDRLNKKGVLVRNILADTNYSSGKNYYALENMGLVPYIPAHGNYKGGPEGFNYRPEVDQWLCSKGKPLEFRKEYTAKDGSKKREYKRSSKLCEGCDLFESCIKKRREKQINVSAYKPQIDAAIDRIKTKNGYIMSKTRGSTVEPVFGSLINNHGMKKVNVRGIKNVNKVFIMTAIAYNLKKYMKFNKRVTKVVSNTLHQLKNNFFIESNTPYSFLFAGFL